jgi:hypothetical protein
MQDCAQSMRLRFPFRFSRKFSREMRFPKSNVADAANAKNGYELRTLFTLGLNLFRIGRQLIFQGKMPLLRWDGERSQRTI